MSRLRNRPRFIVALSLGVALALGAVGGVVATSFVEPGRTVKAVKVVTDDEFVQTNDHVNWADVPNSSVTMTVPGGTKALFLITFSAWNYCTTAACTGFVRVLINDNTIVPWSHSAAGSLSPHAIRWPAATRCSSSHL